MSVSFDDEPILDTLQEPSSPASAVLWNQQAAAQSDEENSFDLNSLPLPGATSSYYTKLILALLCLLALCASWITESELLQRIQEEYPVRVHPSSLLLFPS